MKLWLLKPVENLPVDCDPWIPWFDKTFGFVIRAETEEEARRLADLNAGDENRFAINPWINPKYSTCIHLTDKGKPGIITNEICAA